MANFLRNSYSILLLQLYVVFSKDSMSFQNECIDFNQWTTTYTSLNWRGYMSLVCNDIADNIYIVSGGSNDNGRKRWLYNTTNNHISQAESISDYLTIWSVSSVLKVDNYCYFSGSSANNDQTNYKTNNFWRFNPLDTSIDKIGDTYPKPHKVGNDCFAADNKGNLYTFGGRVGDNGLGSTGFAMFDISNNVWRAGPQLNSARHSCACTYSTLDKKLYVFGGIHAGWSMETYDIMSTNALWIEKDMPYWVADSNAFISSSAPNQIFVVKSDMCVMYITNIQRMVKCHSTNGASNSPSHIFLPNQDKFYIFSGRENVYAGQLKEAACVITISALQSISALQHSIPITVDSALLCSSIQTVYIELKSSALNIDSILILTGVYQEIDSCLICDAHQTLCNNCSEGWLSLYPNQFNVPMVHNSKYWIQSTIFHNNINYNVVPVFDVTVDVGSVMFNMSKSKTTIYPWQPIPIQFSSYFLSYFTEYQLSVTSPNDTLKINNTILNILTNENQIAVCDICYDDCNNCTYGFLPRFEGQIVIEKDSDQNVFTLEASLMDQANKSAIIDGFNEKIQPFINISAVPTSIIYAGETVTHLKFNLSFILGSNTHYEFELFSANDAFIISRRLYITTNNEKMVKCQLCLRTDFKFCNECIHGLVVEQTGSVVSIQGTNQIEFWINAKSINPYIPVVNDGFYIRITTFKNLHLSPFEQIQNSINDNLLILSGAIISICMGVMVILIYYRYKYAKSYIVDKALVLIIGVSQFEEREWFLPGVPNCVNQLRELWEEKYNYDVYICNTVFYSNKVDIIKFIDDHRHNLEEKGYKSVIVHVLSHGVDEGTAFATSDKKKVKLDHILPELTEYAENKDNLVKILFSHICRGEADYSNGDHVRYPTNKDLIDDTNIDSGIGRGIGHTRSSSDCAEDSNWTIICGNVKGRVVSDDGYFTTGICDEFDKNISKCWLRREDFSALMINITNSVKEKTNDSHIPETSGTLLTKRIILEKYNINTTQITIKTKIRACIECLFSNKRKLV
eukprot:555801_1